VLAPLTALLVVQVTMYQTLRSAVQRVVTVVAGVVVAVALSAVAGFTWWSLAILVTASLAVGYVLRLGDHILEVPISAMLILSLGGKAAATGRIVETLAGTAAGMLGGLILTPLRVQPAEEAIEELSRGLASLLEQMADDLGDGSTAAGADQRLAQARALDREIQRVNRALAEAEESLRLNPRGRLLQHTRITLRDGLETLEHAMVTVRGIARGVADGSRLDGSNPVHDAETRDCLAAILRLSLQLSGLSGVSSVPRSPSARDLRPIASPWRPNWSETYWRPGAAHRAANRTAARRAERAGLAPPWRAACPHRPLARRASARTPRP
jgi:Aromatic acid exporter family member 1